LNVSRSPFEFLQRHGITDELTRPAPRLALGDLLVQQLPLSSPPQPAASVLRAYEGTPPPDRAAARPWPGTLTSENSTP
jgi:hypothetical protein